jgi:hypothetical protein
MRDKFFWKQVEENKKIVKTWPKWMQNIVITAETCSTGKFIKNDK